LYFLRVLYNVPAFLVMIYFIGDQLVTGPTSQKGHRDGYQVPPNIYILCLVESNLSKGFHHGWDDTPSPWESHLLYVTTYAQSLSPCPSVSKQSLQNFHRIGGFREASISSTMDNDFNDFFFSQSDMNSSLIME
jgi:hypothetical protein